MGMTADTASERVRSAAARPSKARGSRLQTLTRVDKRTALGRRIIELKRLFSSALASTGVEISPFRTLKVDAAAYALAVAEHVRGRYMRDGGGDLDDLIRAERRADSLVKKLGLPPDPVAQRPASGQDAVDVYLASRARATS